jgi:hypothetical protein
MAWRIGLVFTALVTGACVGGAEPHTSSPATSRASASPVSSPVQSSPTVSRLTPAPITPSPSPPAGNYGSLPQGLLFTPAAGYRPPDWLPPHIRLAPPAPASSTCGVDAQGIYRALVRFDPHSSAGAVTIQINVYHGPGTYANTSGGTDVDVEISPPRSDLTGLTAFQQPSVVEVAVDGVSGSLEASLLQGNAHAGKLSGAWRCG